LFVGLILTALGLDAWQRSSLHAGDRMWLDNVVCASALPFQGALVAGMRWGERQWQVLAQGRELRRENERLSAEVGELHARLMQLEEGYAQMARESAVRGRYPATTRQGRVARVVAAGSGGWLSYLVVGAGTEAGVRVKDVALTADGVVGQVYAVTSDSARVVPITDPSAKVAALLKDSRETGILVGTGGPRCELRFLAPNAQVKPGAVVLTAGTGGVFPKGLPLGRVVSVGPEPHGVGKRAVVEPAVEFRKLEEVLLVHAAAPR
jgi:rod shape-determining protein MreC